MENRPQVASDSGDATAKSRQEFEFKFPHIPPAAQDMMREVLEIIEENLGAELLQSQTVPEVQYFRSPDGSAEGSVVMRAGRDRAYVSGWVSNIRDLR